MQKYFQSILRLKMINKSILCDLQVLREVLLNYVLAYNFCMRYQFFYIAEVVGRSIIMI